MYTDAEFSGTIIVVLADLSVEIIR